ncbi:MAG: outer membrane protein assembly factor BamB [Quisquiliibacterium sp.]
MSTFSRIATRAIAFALAGALAGCGSIWPWSAPSKPPMPQPPAVATVIPAKLAWTYRLAPGGAGFMPAYSAGSIFAASAAGAVVRLDAVTGREAWRVDLGKKIVAGVGSDGRAVAVALEDGVLVALDVSGKQRWSASLGADAVTVPAVGEGLVVVRTGDNRVQAFDLASGKRRWIFSRQNPPLVLHQTASITLTPDTAYVGLPGGRLVALDMKSGAVRWEASIAQARGATEIERIADVVGTPLVRSGLVCAANYNGRLACFDALSGRARWSREVSSITGVEIDSRLVVSVDEKDKIHAFSTSGSSVWRQEKYSGRVLSAPISVGPVLVFGDSKGLVHLASRDDGAVVGRFTGDGTPIIGQGVAAERTAVLQSVGGLLIAVAID